MEWRPGQIGRASAVQTCRLSCALCGGGAVDVTSPLCRRSAAEEDWPRAAPWLQLAGASVESVLAACPEAPGLDTYLQHALTDPALAPLPYQTANQALRLLCDRAPETVAPLLLSESAPTEYRAEPPLEALLRLLEEPGLPEEAAQSARLAALLLLSRAGAPPQRTAPLLEPLTETTLAGAGAHLLVTRAAGRGRLSELAEVVAAGRPELLAAGLAALAAAGEPPLPQLTALLLEAADTTDRTAAQRYQLLLRELLELRLQVAPPAAVLGEPVTVLVRMYLGGLVGAFASADADAPSLAAQERQRLGGQCGPRAAWLNLVPPFAGRTPQQSVADMETDPRLVDLVMLQVGTAAVDINRYHRKLTICFVVFELIG